MTSSTSFELALAQGGVPLGRVTATSLDPHGTAVCDDEADASAPLCVRVSRPPGSSLFGRVRVGEDVLYVVRPGEGALTFDTDAFSGEYGEASLVYEEYEADAPEAATPLLELTFGLRARPEVEALYERLVADLEALHAGLAQDILSRTTHRFAMGRAPALPVRPEEDLRRLTELQGALARALERIGAQPSLQLVSEARRERWRPGARLRMVALSQFLSEPGTVVVDGRVRALGRVSVQRIRTTTDIAEHRHLREGLRRLASRSRAVALHCARMATLHLADRARWGRSRDLAGSVYAKRALPRIRLLEGWQSRADDLARSFEDLVRAYPFVADAGPVRSRLGPTPIFMNRSGYQEAYAALLRAEELSGPLVEGDEIRVRYRQLSTLFEYWCFVKAVDVLRRHPGLGPLEPRDAFTVIDDVYRPELAPGQSFRFPWGRGRSVTVTYEPDFAPEGRPTPASGPFRASLSEAPLRPDVTIQIDGEAGPPSILVLDAKSHARFDPKTLWETTDYRSRVFDPATGHQPVRQVFLLHRDATAAPLVNLPGYLDQRTGTVHSSIIGAVAFLPDRTEAVHRVIERFLGIFG